MIIFGLMAARSPAEEEPLEYQFMIRSRSARVQLIGPAHGHIEQIRISVENSSIRPQVIDCQTEGVKLLPGVSPIRFETADYNGDGFKDFSVQDGDSSPPNSVRRFFFWSPRARKFAQRKDVRDSDVSAFENGVFSGYYRGGPWSAEHWTYQFHRGRFIPVRRVTRISGRSLLSVIPGADAWEVYIVTKICKPDGSFRTFYRRLRPGQFW